MKTSLLHRTFVAIALLSPLTPVNALGPEQARAAEPAWQVF